MGVKRPSDKERLALVSIGSQPIVRPGKVERWTDSRPSIVRERTGQSFIYHTCIFIGSVEALQDSLNEKQRELEIIYGPWVECINVYRHNTTRDGGQRVLAFFKIFIGVPPGPQGTTRTIAE